VTLKAGSSGIFDIAIDERVVFSRHATGRFPSDAEVDALAKR